MKRNLLRSALLCAALALDLVSCRKALTVRVQCQYPGDKALWNHTFNYSQAFLMPDSMPAAIIIPHHDICNFQQNSFYRALSEKGSPSVVVVISPDHFEQGKALIAAPKDNVMFETAEGELPLDKKILRSLSKSGFSGKVDFSDTLWIQEHGIFIHTPYIRHYFPKAKLVPLLLKPLAVDSDFSTFKALSEFLARELPPDALVVASVDFSHYQIPRMTELHDHVSLNTIANFESPRNIEVDSPESLYTLMEYCSERDTDLPVLLHRTSTYDFIPDEFVESTSHQYWAFFSKNKKELLKDFRNKAQASKQRTSFIDYKHSVNQTVLIGGSGNVGAGIRTRWDWDRYNTATDPGEVTLRGLAGKEARFLHGFDACIFDPEPGTIFERTNHGTRLRVKSCGLSDGYPALGSDSTSNCIDILIISYDSSAPHSLPSKEQTQSLVHEYNLVVLRDTAGLEDALVYTKDTDCSFTEINLGILKSGDGNPVSGNILVADWQDGRCELHTFSYQSQTDCVGPIHQFLPGE